MLKYVKAILWCDSKNGHLCHVLIMPDAYECSKEQTVSSPSSDENAEPQKMMLGNGEGIQYKICLCLNLTGQTLGLVSGPVSTSGKEGL